MTASNDHTRNAFSSLDYRHYSVIGDAGEAWSNLASLKVFGPADSSDRLDIIDVMTGDSQKQDVTSNTFNNAREVADHLSSVPITRGTRFVSIWQKNSWASLAMTQSTLETIMQKYDMMPEFLETVRCFQDKTCNVEEAFGGSSWNKYTQYRKEMTTVFKYPEHNGRTDGADPWSIRQTGLYQGFECSAKASLWVLVNPREKTVADSRIRAALNAQDSSITLHEQPPLVGLVVLSAYLGNWRTYMAYYEKEELRMSGTIISTIIEEKLQFSHSTLSQLRRLEARLLLLPTIFHSLNESVRMLKSFNDALRGDGSISDKRHSATQEILENYSNIVAAYNQNAKFILNKIRGTAQLLSDTLNLKHQQIAQNISENTLALNNAALKDSATIRVVTVVTLLFLPAQFIATLFGMQFFSTDSTGTIMISSSSIWIFFAIAMPFTATIFGYWKWYDRKQRLKARFDEIESKR